MGMGLSAWEGGWPPESCSALTKALRVPVLTERASAGRWTWTGEQEGKGNE